MIDDPQTLTWLFAAIGILALLAVPLAGAVALPVVVALWLGRDSLPPDFFDRFSLAMRLNSPALLSIPLFAVAGELAVISGIAGRLIQVADLFGGHGNRAAGPRTVLGCGLFATVSGVGTAAVTAESKRLTPILVRAGFTTEAASAALACAATLSIVIPASIPMTVYAATVGVPMNAIAASSFFPGLLMAVFLLAAMALYSYRRLAGGRLWRDPPGRALVVLWGAKWSLLLPALVLPGLFTSLFSAPEAAAFSCVYCVAVGRFAHGGIKAEPVREVVARAATGSAAVLLLAGVGGLFAVLLEGGGVSGRMAAFVYQSCGGRIGAIIFINIFLLAAGCFLDMPAIISLLVPPLLPLAQLCGMGPAHFGAVVVMNIAVGLVTPPQARNLAAAAHLAGIGMGGAARASLPFVAAMLACLALTSFVPELCLWFPSLFGWPT